MTTMQGDDCLKKLPSKEVYAKFDGAASPSDCKFKGTIYTDLWIFPHPKERKEEIEKGLCYASKLEQSDSLYDKCCNYVYYWIGNIMEDKEYGILAFKSAISVVYNYLQKYTPMWKCTNTYRDVDDKTIFDHLKELFDYTQDQQHIQQYIQNAISQEKGDRTCFEKYREYLQAANGACNILTRQCTPSGRTTQKEYCKLFTQVCKGNNTIIKPSDLLTELITTENKLQRPQEEGHLQLEDRHTTEVSTIPEVKDPPDLREAHLDCLPSRMLYKKFRDKVGECEKTKIQSAQTALESVLKGYNCKGDCALKVMSAWCYINGSVQDNNDPLYDDRFNIFYSWLGLKMFGHAGNSDKISFPMNQIYSTLKGLHEGKQCGDMCEDVYLKEKQDDDDTFKYIKLLAEYFTDSKKFKEQLGNDSTEKKCEAAYNDHLKQIIDACNAIKLKCPEDMNRGDGDYCKWFHKHNEKNGESGDKKYCDEDELAKLTCTPVIWNRSGSSGIESTVTCNPASSELGDQANSDSALGGDPGSGVEPGGVVGGVLGVVGLPAVVLALYKYTSLFDGIKNSLFGGSNNRRGRRSTVRHNQHFDDTFTGNDFSTLGGDGSTTLGGRGGGGSTTLGGSSTDVSTIYNEPPRRPNGRGRTQAGINNRRPGNIRYYAT